MAILQSCCCWQSVRKGSYVSALYTMSYFLLTCFTMSVTIHHDWDYYWNKNDTVNLKPKNASFLEPAEISSVTMVYYLIIFVLSILGIFTSLLLILGLYFELRFLLIPWMVIISASSFVDVSHSIYWLTLDDPSFTPVTAIFFTFELFVFLLHMYSLLCVLSQYQEYKAGRGTAAYDTLLETIRRREQVPSLSVRCSQQHTTGTSYLTTTVSHSTRDFYLLQESSVQNADIIMDNIKSRRVQFTNEDPILTFSSSNKPVLDSESTYTGKDHHSELADPDDAEEDDIVGRSDYLWCAAADERVLICDLPSARRGSKDVRPTRKRSSVSEENCDKSIKNSKIK